MSQLPHDDDDDDDLDHLDHPHYHPDESKSSSDSSSSTPSSSSSSSSSSSFSIISPDILTSELEHLDLESSQYAYRTHQAIQNTQAVEFSCPPLFRCGNMFTLHPDECDVDLLKPSLKSTKDLYGLSGYIREKAVEAGYLDRDSHIISSIHHDDDDDDDDDDDTKSSSSRSSLNVSRDNYLRRSHAHLLPIHNPGYVEPCYHFKFSTSPIELLITVLKILDHLHVDITIRDGKYYKIICTGYHHGYSTSFIVRIWRPSRPRNLETTLPIPEPDFDNNTTTTTTTTTTITIPPTPTSTSTIPEYWCEFQRRTGDRLYFSDLYYQCVQAISSGNIQNAEIPTRKIILPGIDHVQPSQQESADTFKCLMQMASSPCSDIRSRALVALSELSSENATIRNLIVQHGGLETMHFQNIDQGFTRFTY